MGEGLSIVRLLTKSQAGILIFVVLIAVFDLYSFWTAQISKDSYSVLRYFTLSYFLSH